MKEIAKEMHLSPGTSRNQLSHVMTKIDCKNRMEAVHLAMTKGWI
ncbi:response regulator transcription factor [Shouchella sp. JSM 1781072]